MEFWHFIADNRIILIPALMFIGWFIKNTRFIGDKYIPLVVLSAGILLSIWLEMGVNAHAVIHGMLVAGAAVLSHQIPKQLGKKE